MIKSFVKDGNGVIYKLLADLEDAKGQDYYEPSFLRTI